MVIVLTILKIVGIVLLVLACLIALILFFPIRYEFTADIDEGSYTMQLGWLFRLVGFRFRYQKNIQAILRILFIRIDLIKLKNQKERKKAKKRSGKKEKKKRLTKQEKKRKKARKRVNLEEESVESDRKAADISTETQIKVKDTSESVQTKAKRKLSFSEIREKISGVTGMIKMFREKELFSIVWPKLSVFLIRIHPRKLRGSIQFGFDDPAMTGQVLGVVAAIPFIYQTDLSICPDFETDKNYISGNVYMKGRMHVIHLVQLVVGILLDKRVRSVIHTIRKQKSK
jgi:hypothetical protein